MRLKEFINKIVGKNNSTNEKDIKGDTSDNTINDLEDKEFNDRVVVKDEVILTGKIGEKNDPRYKAVALNAIYDEACKEANTNCTNDELIEKVNEDYGYNILPGPNALVEKSDVTAAISLSRIALNAEYPEITKDIIENFGGAPKIIMEMTSIAKSMAIHQSSSIEDVSKWLPNPKVAMQSIMDKEQAKEKQGEILE